MVKETGFFRAFAIIYITDGERKEETWILAYLKFAGATTSMLPRPVSINNSQGWLWGEAPEITGRQHTSTQLCAGTGQVSSFLSPTVKWYNRRSADLSSVVIPCLSEHYSYVKLGYKTLEVSGVEET
ncbi:hypothetical protein J6590_075387 [Homalodisca vitripennis]|nr:hypothetical protein J6590_075387 [Homalodisca vitripennis]